MKKRYLALPAAAVVLLAGCGTNANRDIEGVPTERPDVVRVFDNVDQHPNVVMLCIDGAGFATTTRQYNAITRVETWDTDCKAAKDAKATKK